MRHLILALSSAAFVAAPAAAGSIGPGPSRSWGKAHVSLAEYRDDAVACGRQAAALDIAGTPPAEAFIIASRMIDNAPDAWTTVDAMRIASPERNKLKVGDMLQAELERCLAGRGYHRFKLTAAQRHHLAKLPVGSDERHAYLHSLASDSGVRARQAAD